MSAFPELGYGSDLVRSERLQVGIALKQADLVTTGSAAMARRARKRVPSGHEGRVIVAPLGIDIDRFRAPLPRREPEDPVPAKRDGTKRASRGHAVEIDRDVTGMQAHLHPRPVELVAVAELNRIKDYPTLLVAFGLVLKRRREVRLNIVGGGPELAEIRRHPVARNHDASIRWWGQIPPSAVPLALAKADVFVHASRHEGQGMVLAEAGAAGLPIASTRVGMAASFPSWSIALAKPGNSADLADAIERAIVRHERWSGRGPSAHDRRLELRCWIERRYARSRCAERWLRSYRLHGLIASTGGARP